MKPVNITELRSLAARAQARRFGSSVTVELTPEELINLCDRVEHAERELGERPTLRRLAPVSDLDIGACDGHVAALKSWCGVDTNGSEVA